MGRTDKKRSKDAVIQTERESKTGGIVLYSTEQGYRSQACLLPDLAANVRGSRSQGGGRSQARLGERGNEWMLGRAQKQNYKCRVIEIMNW